MQLQKKLLEILFKKLPSLKRQEKREYDDIKKRDKDLDLFSEENLNKIKPEEKKEYDDIKKGFKY